LLLAAGEPQLVLTTLKPVYAAGEAPVLLLRLAVPASAGKNWTVTSFEAGAVRVESLFRRAIVRPRRILKGSEVKAQVSVLSPNTGLLAEAQRGVAVLHPNGSLGIPLQIVRDPATGMYSLRVEAVPRTKKLGQSILDERLLSYVLSPGLYSLQLSYEPHVASVDASAPAAPKVVSNSITFEME